MSRSFCVLNPLVFIFAKNVFWSWNGFFCRACLCFQEEVATEKQKMADVDMKLTMARRERSLQNMRTIVSYVKMAVEPIHLICVRVGISPYIDLIFDYLLDKPLQVTTKINPCWDEWATKRRVLERIWLSLYVYTQGTTILSVIITALFIVTGKKKKRSPAKETKDKEDETTKEDEASTETTQVESMEQNKTPSRVRRRKA